MRLDTRALLDSARREWNSLNSEVDPILYWEGAFGLAARQETSGHLEIATSVYFELSENAAVPAGLRRRARERLEILQGGGSPSARAEHLLRHFVETAADPAALMAMTTAGMVFSAARLGFLARLAGAEAAPWTRGFLGRTVAASGAFLLEAPAFTLTARLGNTLLGRPQEWDARSLARELTSAYLTLGGLKLGLAGGHALHRALGGVSQRGLGYQVFFQGGMLSGLRLGHGLENYFGLRGPALDSNPWIDSLATLLHFNVAGRLMNGTFGSLRAWQNILEARSESLGARQALFMSVKFPDPPLLPAGAACGTEAGTVAASTRLEPQRPPVSLHETGGEKPTPLAAIRTLPDKATNPLTEPPSETASVEEYPQLISEWGDAFMEQSRSVLGRFLPELRRLNEKISGSATLISKEHRRLRGFLRTVTARLEAFRGHWDTLRSRRRHSDPLGSRDNNSRERLRLVLHDLQYRTEPLTMAKLALETVLLGNPIRPYQQAYLFSPGSGFSASGAIRDGIARASVDTPEVFQWIGREWHRDSLDDLRFAAGRDTTKIAGDIVANLVANAARYRSSERPLIRIAAEPSGSGGLRVTVQDDGIGILPEHLATLGESGFREGRRNIARSQGLGLTSVIASLRSLGWGPLWVSSRPGEGSRFRFEIPAAAFLETPSPEFQGKTAESAPESSLEGNLREGFVVPAASLDLAIRQLLRELPNSRSSMYAAVAAGSSRIQSLANGEWRHRRLEALHRLLATGRNMQDLEVVENGPGVLLDIAVTLASLGSRIRVKDVDGLSSTIYQAILETDIPTPLQERISITPRNELDLAGAADIAYWANPEPLFLHRLAASRSEGYLGRDVRPGGYLVIQTDHRPTRHPSETIRSSLPRLDPSHWREIFEGPLPNLPLDSNAVLPTAQGPHLHLQVFQRR